MTQLPGEPASTTLAEQIRMRGHWHVVLRPVSYEEALLPYGDLWSIMQSTSVQLRGWDVPHINTRQPPSYNNNWIETATDWDYHRETWRFYQSGQFVHLSALRADWQELSRWSPPRSGWEPGQSLDVTDTLWTLGEYFTLASRLVLALPKTPSLVVRLKLRGLQNRVLTVDDPRRAPFAVPRTTATTEYDTGAQEYGSDELVATHKELAVVTAQQLFARFGWNPEPAMLRENLDELWALR